MFKVVYTVSLFLILCMSSLPASAADVGKGGGEGDWIWDWPPSVCDELREPGVTRGLFALCYAYCEWRDCDSYEPGHEPRRCKRLLRWYNRRADEFDPPMPCLAEEPPQDDSCPCWGAGELLEIASPASGLYFDDSFACGTDGGTASEMSYGYISFNTTMDENFDGDTHFMAGADNCMYMSTVEQMSIMVDEPILSSGQEATCRREVRELINRDVAPGTCPE